MQLWKNSESYFFVGKFFKEANINVEHQRDAKNKAKVDPIVSDVYPKATFILDLVKHRIYWFYPKEETFPPQAYDFASYIKKKVYKPIKAEYIQQIKGEYKSINKKDESYRDYESRRLLELNMTRKLFTVKAVPLIDEEGMKQAILDEDYVIRSVVAKGYLPNSTKKDGEELRDWSDPFDKVTEKAKTNWEQALRLNFEV